jgi:hypothetical protein
MVEVMAGLSVDGADEHLQSTVGTGAQAFYEPSDELLRLHLWMQFAPFDGFLEVPSFGSRAARGVTSSVELSPFGTAETDERKES